MTTVDAWAESLNRAAKLALDTGEAASPDEALRIFAGYRLQIVAGPDVADSPVKQAALLTAVNAATRTFLGGVTVVGPSGPLLVTLPRRQDIASAVVSLGGNWTTSVDPSSPTLVIGDVETTTLESLAVRATFDGWKAGACPASRAAQRLPETGDCVPAGVAAVAIAVGEVFQRLRGSPVACRRPAGLSLWRPEQDWRDGEVGPALTRLPAALWIVGLGNLGQAYLWTLGLLPYADEDLSLVLQDLDVLAPSNLSTSLLTAEPDMRRRKTRAIAEWAEARGFKASIVERKFKADFRVGDREPALALIGVDNSLARQSIEWVGFTRVIEAGLGKGPQEFLGVSLHTFPGSISAADTWNDIAAGDVDIAQPAYRALLEASGDRCGVVRLAGRSIAAPFVGALAGAMVIAEALKLSSGRPRREFVSCQMGNLPARTVVAGAPWPPSAIGAVVIDANIARAA